MTKPETGERARAAGPPRYVVRQGGVRGEGWYVRKVWDGTFGFDTPRRDHAHVFSSRAEAQGKMTWEGRVVRLLSPAEARDRHASTVLRAEADKHIKVAEALVMGRISGRFVREGMLTVAYALLDEADRLWPPKPTRGAKRAGGRGR